MIYYTVDRRLGLLVTGLSGLTRVCVMIRALYHVVQWLRIRFITR